MTTDALGIGIGVGVGAQAPDIELAGADGAVVRLSALWSGRPLVLVVLADLASPFASDHAAQLRDGYETFGEVGAGLAVICGADIATAAAFRDQWSLHYPLLADPARAAYGAFSVTGSAEFVIDSAGAIRYARRTDTPGDYPSTMALFAACCAITGATMPEAPPPVISPHFDAPASLVGLRAAPDDPVTRAGSSYVCAKCGCIEYKREQVTTSGGFWSRIFNVEHRKYVAVTCERCGYTELYRRTTGALGNIADFLAR